MNLWLYRLSYHRRLLILLAFGCVIFGIRAPILRRVGLVLEVPSSADARADVAVLLMGELVGRGEAAAKVIRAGRSEKIIWGRTEATMPENRGYVKNESDLTEELLLKNGVPHSRMIKVDTCRNDSTFAEAQCFLRYFEDHPPMPKSFLIITTWSHTRRATWIFKKVFGGRVERIEVESVESPELPKLEWWRHEGTAFGVLFEYIKWAYYLRKY